MGIVLNEIKSNERVEFTGDVHITGNIGKGAVVTIRNGNLTVDGNVEDDARINLPQQRRNGRAFGVNTYSDADQQSVMIHGSVGSNTIIKTENASIDVDGDVGSFSQIKTYNGEIRARNIGKRTKLKTYNGNVSAEDMNSASVLRTDNGNIRARNLAADTRASTYNGNVDVQAADSSANLSTTNGDIYVNGVRRPRPQHATFSSIVTNGSGRVFVNGREITAHGTTRRYDPYTGAKTGAASGFGLGLITSLVLCLTVFMPPLLPFMIAITAAAIVGTLLGAWIGHAIQGCVTAPSVVDSPQVNQGMSSMAQCQKMMGGSTFTIHNEPGSIIGQQNFGDVPAVGVPLEYQKTYEDTRSLTMK